jgi:hypothetical protein
MSIPIFFTYKTVWLTNPVIDEKILVVKPQFGFGTTFCSAVDTVGA